MWGGLFSLQGSYSLEEKEHMFTDNKTNILEWVKAQTSAVLSGSPGNLTELEQFDKEERNKEAG